VRNACWSNDERSFSGDLMFITNGEPSVAAQNKINLVGLLVCVNWLHLLGFETIQADHYVSTLPESSFMKLLGVNALEVSPVEKVRHDDSLRFEDSSSS